MMMKIAKAMNKLEGRSLEDMVKEIVKELQKKSKKAS